MCKPKCPICGVASTWIRFSDEVHDCRPDLRNRFPDECHFCKDESRIHQKQWEEGIDVTQYGGPHIRNPHPTRDGNGH